MCACVIMDPAIPILPWRASFRESCSASSYEAGYRSIIAFGKSNITETRKQEDFYRLSKMVSKKNQMMILMAIKLSRKRKEPEDGFEWSPPLSQNRPRLQ